MHNYRNKQPLRTALRLFSIFTRKLVNVILLALLIKYIIYYKNIKKEIKFNLTIIQNTSTLI